MEKSKNVCCPPEYKMDDFSEFFEREKARAFRLNEIESIIGNEYNMDRLRELVEADRDGRVEILTGESREMDTIRDLVKIITWITDSVQEHDFSPFRVVKGAIDTTFPVTKEWDKAVEKHSEIIYLAFKDLETKFKMKGNRNEN